MLNQMNKIESKELVIKVKKDFIGNRKKIILKVSNNVPLKSDFIVWKTSMILNG